MENCGRGHDVSQICCNHAELVQTRLADAERILSEIDDLTVVILCGDTNMADAAQAALAMLLTNRVRSKINLP